MGAALRAATHGASLPGPDQFQCTAGDSRRQTGAAAGHPGGAREPAGFLGARSFRQVGAFRLGLPQQYGPRPSATIVKPAAYASPPYHGAVHLDPLTFF
jgi:hypothetical protein